MGQLRMLIRARYLIDAVGLNRVRGKPYRIAEIEDAARLLADGDRRMTDTGAAPRRRAAAQPENAR